MIDIEPWLEQYIQAVENTFGQRIQFIGLQGSYGRGEATEASDIDVVLILDHVAAADICMYGDLMDTLPNREKVCGFMSGRAEIKAWEPSDLFQFYHDTKAIRGSLDALMPSFDDAVISRAIKIGACNIYHGCVHNMLHEKSTEILQGLYKAATFVIQAICYQQTGCYFCQKTQMMAHLEPEERGIIEAYLRLKSGDNCVFQQMSVQLYDWTAKWIART